ncbi:MAG: helix-turn-helix domain-containing protein [Chitinophagaceae bacterium]
MISFKYAMATFDDLLQSLGEKLTVKVEDDLLNFPESVGLGYLKSVSLPNGLEALIGDLTLRQDLLIERSRINKEFYVFICDRVTGVKKFIVDIDKDRLEKKNTEFSAMYLLSFLSDLSQFATAGTQLSTIRVIISKDWMAKYLKMDELDDVLQRYLSLKSKSIHVRDFDFDSQVLMDEILNPPKDSLLEKTFIQNRIMMLLENFFAWLYQQMAVMELNIKMTRDEIDQISEVETQLLSNLSQAPTINQLARQAAMSPSKLKKQFKDVFGLPIYEYFQKNRMQKARQLLLEGNRSVKAVGMEMGFSNLSNFSLAFKKEFQELPSELLKSNVLT